LQPRALADADAALVQVGAAALGGGEQVVAAGVVDDGLLDLAAHGQRNADAIDGEAVDEVGGAVQRIDDPDVVRILGSMLAARFLGQDAVVGVGGEQGFDDGLSLAWSTSVTKSLTCFCEIRTASTSSAARLMMAPAARAALTATLSMGCRLGDDMNC
jgi:hypothetical protein